MFDLWSKRSQNLALSLKLLCFSVDVRKSYIMEVKSFVNTTYLTAQLFQNKIFLNQKEFKAALLSEKRYKSWKVHLCNLFAPKWYILVP